MGKEAVETHNSDNVEIVFDATVREHPTTHQKSINIKAEFLKRVITGKKYRVTLKEGDV